MPGLVLMHPFLMLSPSWLWRPSNKLNGCHSQTFGTFYGQRYYLLGWENPLWNSNRCDVCLYNKSKIKLKWDFCTVTSLYNTVPWNTMMYITEQNIENKTDTCERRSLYWDGAQVVCWPSLLRANDVLATPKLSSNHGGCHWWRKHA